MLLRHDNDPDRTDVPNDDDDDDDTTTLRSCFDIPCDVTEGQAQQYQTAQTMAVSRDVAGFSDLSSADSTPVRKPRSVRRSLTMKQKRQASKERYRTYTIAADMMLSTADTEPAELDDHSRNDGDDNVRRITGHVEESDDVTQNVEIEIVEGKTMTRLTPRQRRQEDRIRFQTQVRLSTASANDIV